MAGSEALRFTVLEGVAAPLGLDNVDTDMIIPKQYLKTVKRTGLGKYAFDEMRYDNEGRERADFILNREPYRQARILLAGANFGCGSSREHAPWALKDFGVTCVIAESFADIFFNNCFQNGMLPVALPRSALAVLNEAAAGSSPILRVDLERQTVSVPGGGDGVSFAFDIEAGRKVTLLEGLDAIGLTLRHEAAITGFEEQDRKLRPWLYRRRIDSRLS